MQALTTGQLARRLGVSPSTIRAHAAAGRLPSRETPGGHRRYDEVEVRRALDGLEAAPTDLGSLRLRRRRLLALAKRHGASNVRVVGSVARGEGGAASDVDLVVDLESNRTLFDVAALHDDLVAELGVEVDIITSGAVRGRLAHLLDDAVPL